MKNRKLISQYPYGNVYWGLVDGVETIEQEFDRTAVNANNLEDSILFNQYIFCDTSLKTFSDAFLLAEFDQTDELYVLRQPACKQTLDEFIKCSKSISEAQALDIFDQILKPIYSLFIDNLVRSNIRPQHFGFINGKWVLKSTVFSRENYNINNEYTLNPKYQAPQEYDVENQDDLDPCQIIVWNLGSILVDMIVGSHILSNQKILKKFKNQEFSFNALKINRKISFDLEGKLGKMLHYDPSKRMKISQIFQNPFFSKDVAKHYKQNKEMAAEAIKQVVKGPGMLRSSIRSSIKESMIRGSKMIPKSPKQLNISSRGFLNSSGKGLLTVPNNEVKKSTLKMLDIDANVSKQNLMQSQRNNGLSILATAIKQDDEFLMELAEKSTIIKMPKWSEDEPELSAHTIVNTPWLKNIFTIYKTFIDRSELLCVSVHKFSEIPYEDNFRNQFILLNEFSVYYVSLIELNKIIQSINKNHNVYKINSDNFDEFLRSKNFEAFKQGINALFMSKKQIFEEKAAILMNLPENQQKLMKLERFIKYVQERNIYDNTFAEIKKPYREILKMTYDKISVLFNSTKQELLCRLSLYTVYCMTIDKLYIEEDIEDNFKPFLEWITLVSTRKLEIDNQKKYFIICVRELQRYFDTAPIKLLIQHSKKILRKYYKI